MAAPKIVLSPSLMCADLLNLSDAVKALEEIGVDALHIDLIDSAFSPSMPLGLETIKQLRKATNLPFDIHIMSMNNEWFIQQVLEIGVQRVSFHYETSLHPDRLVNLIKKHNVEAGVALNPATSLTSLDYLLPSLDYVLLMLINPGFAGDKNETQVPYAMEKVRNLREKICGLDASVAIQVDGRVSLPRSQGLSPRARIIWYLAAPGCLLKARRLLTIKRSWIAM